MKTMEHFDLGSIKSLTITMICGIFSLWTKADIAVYCTILAALSTFIVNIVKLINKDKK